MKRSGEFESNGRWYRFFTRKSDGVICVNVVRANGRELADAHAVVQDGNVEFYMSGSGAGYKLADLRNAVQG